MIKGLILLALCTVGLLRGIRGEAAVNPDGSVALNAENFPDAAFREYLMEEYHVQDGILDKWDIKTRTEMTIPLEKPFSVQGNNEKAESGDYYQVWKNYKYQLRLPKKNVLDEVVFQATNKKLDLTQCKQVVKVSVPKTMKVKFMRKWWKKYRDAVVVFKKSVLVEKVNVPKKGKYMWV